MQTPPPEAVLQRKKDLAVTYGQLVRAGRDRGYEYEEHRYKKVLTGAETSEPVCRAATEALDLIEHRRAVRVDRERHLTTA